MPSFRFLQLDVFTRVPLTGNALAVFPDGRGLTDGQMQALAREMNLSETTFVLPSNLADRKLRIFTPAAEVPLAGHPVIGTWWALAELQEIDLRDGVVTVHQETGRGVLPVDIHVRAGRPVLVEMVQAAPEFSTRVTDRAALASALGGPPEALGSRSPFEVVSTAMPQLMVPLAGLAALKALPTGGSGGELARLLRAHGTDCAMCYSLESESREATVQCRMFAPGLGVPEDPATGSAAGALGAYLVRHRLVQLDGGVARIVMDQGIEMGRPSRIHVTVSATSPDEITEVRVGGEAVTIAEGTVRL